VWCSDKKNKTAGGGGKEIEIRASLLRRQHFSHRLGAAARSSASSGVFSNPLFLSLGPDVFLCVLLVVFWFFFFSLCLVVDYVCFETSQRDSLLGIVRHRKKRREGQRKNWARKNNKGKMER